ncbi:uncharacterized protein LOC133178712 [Saccostrea echinata]|uniref:uncharacterized protein LOC133178712 n=1 Tax=Saccostrea echinata TaxID=191078 RepID=UPI002A807B5B|nr:uncharacterized protein LOC133178712 [Saccostrea echinata]
MAKCHNIPLKQIAKLNPNLTNWKIKAKVSFTNGKEKVKPISTGKICRVTLEDESGKIAGISYDDIAECIALNLTNYGKYYITGANIQKAHSSNNTLHKYELHFILNKTEFEDVCSGKLFRLDDEAISRCKKKVCESGNSGAPGGSGGTNFKPTPLAEVLGSQNLLDSKKFDILAILKKTEKSEPLYNNENTQIGRSNRFYRKKVTIIDETGEVILRLASELKKKLEINP